MAPLLQKLRIDGSLPDNPANFTEDHKALVADAHRQAAALEIPPDARDFEAARLLRPALADEADLRGGAAHVEGDDLVLARERRDMGREDRAAGGAGLDQADDHRREAVLDGVRAEDHR